MNKIIILACLVMSLNTYAIGGWGEKNWPTGEIHVDANGKEGVNTIAEAIAMANQNLGNLIIVHPGIYTDPALDYTSTTGTLTTKGEGCRENQVLTGSAELFRLGTSADTLIFENLTFWATAADTIGNIGNVITYFRNCMFAGSLYVMNADSDYYYTNCKFYNRQFYGFQIKDSGICWCENIQFGEPLGVSPGFETYDLRVLGGTLSGRGSFHLYSDSTCLSLNGGQGAIYNNDVILYSRGLVNAPAIDIQSGNINIHGGRIKATCTDRAAIDVDNDGYFLGYYCKIENRHPGTYAYNNSGTGAGGLFNCMFVGAVQLGGSDTDNLPRIAATIKDPEGLGAVGQWLFTNATKDSICIDRLIGYASADNDTFYLVERSNTGASPDTLQTIICTINGTNVYIMNEKKYDAITNPIIAAGSQLWIDPTTTDIDWCSFILVYHYSQ